MDKKIIVIGSGFSGLSAASCLAKEGYNVTVLEKNATPGGRARKFHEQGFTFDMGPSWYWMPEVFEQFFNLFGKKTADFYDLKRLDPSYNIFFKDESVDIPASKKGLFELFEKYEPGSSKHLESFLAEAKYKYQVGMTEFVFKPSLSLTEFADSRILKSLFKLKMFTSIAKSIRSKFKNPKLRQLLEFPVLFLGATPQKTPSLYSLMNYADLVLGTWYPMGGMNKIIEGFLAVAESQGVKIICDQEVKEIYIPNGKAKKVITQNNEYTCDVVINGGDYHHFEQTILNEKDRVYSQSYWDKRVMAPSSLLFYLGVKKKLKNLRHHNLFFDADFDQHAKEIYDEPAWPTKPLFYACCPSVTDQSVAPTGSENLFLLIPLAPEIEDTTELREKYFNIIMDRLEERTGQEIRSAIVYKRSFAHKDFKKDYHSFKGNAYGLANTLWQTAFLKPKLKSKKVSNLYYTGQLTSPGPGVPPSIISGQVVASEIIKTYSV